MNKLFIVSRQKNAIRKCWAKTSIIFATGLSQESAWA